MADRSSTSGDRTSTVQDPYATLDVRSDADLATIRAAYIRRMRHSHPDVRPDDPTAAHSAREANAAWELLRDPKRRAAYDRARHQASRSPVGPNTNAAPMKTPAAAAYSEEKDTYRAAVTRATVKVGAAVFAVGLVLLLALSPLA